MPFSARFLAAEDIKAIPWMFVGNVRNRDLVKFYSAYFYDIAK